MALSEETITVLLADDDRNVADVTRMHLARQDDVFEIVVEDSVEAALGTIDDDVDCVVSDYEMPNRDGLDLLRNVREFDPTLPFILFTGRGSEEIASEAISAGVTDYLQKKIGTDQYAVLANRIKNAVAHRRSAAAAAETESRYRSLVESSPHAILVHDGDEVLYVNDRLVEIVGADDADAVRGSDPLTYVHPEDREMIRDRIQRIFTGKNSGNWIEFRLVTLDGDVCRVETRATLVQYEGTRVSQVVLRDVTDHYRRERRLEALHEATRQLLTAERREIVGEITVHVLAYVFHEPVTGVWAYDTDADALTPLAMSENAARAGMDEPVDPATDPVPDRSVEMAVFESGEPRVIEECADHEDVPFDAFETVFLYPLGDHGLLGIGSSEPRSFDPSERELVGILARSVIATLDRIEGEAG